MNTSKEDEESSEEPYPVGKLQKLEELISNPRWVIPVLPQGELEALLEASNSLARSGSDWKSEHCQRFYREGLVVSFTKIMSDEAVSSWKSEIQKCILQNCNRLMELFVLKMDNGGRGDLDEEEEEAFLSRDLLALVLNPSNKFHIFNSSFKSEKEGDFACSDWNKVQPRGWLVDLLNLFGSLGGFRKLLERFKKPLSVSVIYAYIRPFGYCSELLTKGTVKTYLMPLVEIIPAFLESMSDEDLKKEAKNELKNDVLSSIVKSLKSIVAVLPGEEEWILELEMFRLKIILRQLRISSFGGKMNALNEVNRVIMSVSYFPQRRGDSGVSHGPNNNNTGGGHAKSGQEEDFLTASRMAQWLYDNRVLQIVLQDSLHQPQYVEKLEKIIRFKLKEEYLTMQDLDDIWEAQVGQHEAIVKNVHDLLAKLAWDFSPSQLDHLFERFQSSWSQANIKQREKLLELIRRLAEDDKDGVMADKVLSLFWTLALSEEMSTDMVDQVLAAHIKILDYSCTDHREDQKNRWLEACIKELKSNKNWAIPALKQIREICCLYPESPNSDCIGSHPAPHHHAQNVLYRHEIINRLQSSHVLVIVVADNLTAYIKEIASLNVQNMDPTTIRPDGRYDHIIQVRERLNFLRFLLKDGRLWMCANQAKQIWKCLAEKAVFAEDREACFQWFSKLMGPEPDLDPDIIKDFFVDNILQLDPMLMTEAGIQCFDRFFKAVNSKEKKLIIKRRAYLINNLELIGTEYIWRIIRHSPDEEVANRAIELLEETFTNLGPSLIDTQVDIHEDFISSCMDQLKPAYDTISLMENDGDSVHKYRQLIRVLKVLYQYILECDADFGEERTFVPLFRAPRGKQLSLIIRFPNQGRPNDDLNIWVHTNDTLGAMRRQILQNLKANPSSISLELFYNGETMDPSVDGKVLQSLALKDKSIITGKLAGNLASSPDTSSDSSTSSPQHHFDGPNCEAEQCLPGVIMSKSPKYRQFLLQLADLGCQRNIPTLRDGARAVLKIMPADVSTVGQMKSLCHKLANSNLSSSENGTSSEHPLFSTFFSTSPSQTLYNMEVLYSLLMPGQMTLSDQTSEFQLNLIKAKGIPCFMNILTRKDFLAGADIVTKQLTYISVAKICKFLFCSAGYSFVHAITDCSQSDSLTSSTYSSMHNQAIVLQKALVHVPNQNYENRLRQISQRIAVQLLNQGTSNLTDHATVIAIIRLAWACSSGNIGLLENSSPNLTEELHAPHRQGNVSLHPDQIELCKELLEILTLAIALYPACLEDLNKDKSWHQFIIDLILLSNIKSVRVTAGEQFLMIATRCSSDENAQTLLISLLFSVLGSTATEKAKQSSEYFTLLSRLLLNASSTRVCLNAAETLLNNEITWLKRIRDNVKITGNPGVEDNLLEGHLCITRELVSFLSPSKKHEVGIGLIKDLIEDFIFPASKIIIICHETGEIPMDMVVPVCSTGPTLMAAFDVLVALCTGCSSNLRVVADMLTQMFYSDKEEPLYDWEYLPPVGPRPPKGFVGLKNAGATCYMNSVLQQLFMIEGIRNGVLSVEGACNDPDEDFSGEERDSEVIPNDHHHHHSDSDFGQSRKDYNITILKQVQAIFAHLAYTKLQFYVPRGLWKHFRMQGEPVNLREQQDAVEFFMSLIDFVDEALKALGYEQRMTKILGGVLSDQMICKTCPHRYSREEPFCVLSVEVRNHNNLTDSLHEYVKGELLDGNNAYHCASCDKKVDTTKRLCIKKLPPILVIQLKRFDYDYERECAIKFNDYFEFPRVLDMEPYTVGGLAKIEGEAIDCDPSDLDGKAVRNYKLRGMVVHSGQASGGHYYSYIKSKDKWYKFDDGDVTEVKMDDEEDLKAQCYGGESLSEVFDQLSKKMSCRKQKRWWNAYMLFYSRLDTLEDSASESIVEKMGELKVNGLSQSSLPLRIPAPIARSILRQNVRFLHHRNQYNAEYFQFMKQLINCNANFVNATDNNNKLASDAEELALITVQLAAKFLFQSAFHTKKSLRGPAQEWYDVLSQHLRCSAAVRFRFCQKALFAHPSRFCEYILECPSVEVRTSFVRMIVLIAHFSLNDGPSPVPKLLQQSGLPFEVVGNTLADYLLQTVLSLLWMEVSEHGRHLPQYFNLFSIYASLGVPEKTQLLKLNIPATFIQVALDEGPGPPIKYQYTELAKLYQVVSTLIRCCDVSSKCSSQNFDSLLPNPYADLSSPIMPIQPKVAELVFVRFSYLKKLVEDGHSQEDTKKLFQFCCWENPNFSHAVLYELLLQITIVYTCELRPYLDLLLTVLLLEDSWQTLRIHKALKGIPEEGSSRDGLLDTISRSNSQNHKRAYQCIKLLVSLFANCRAAKNILENSLEIRRKWRTSVEWLNEELERVRGGPGSYAGTGQYSYSNWSPPAQSNENTNGYYLERSLSAKLTLETAVQLIPDDDLEDIDDAEATCSRGTGESDQMISNAGDNDPENVAVHETDRIMELKSRPYAE